MKVLHVGKFFPPHRGGMETFLRDLMIEQQRQGLDVRAIVHRSERSIWSSDETYACDDQNLKVMRVGRWGTAVFAPLSPFFILQLTRILREFKPDILHIHMPNVSAFWCLLALSARRVPWVIQWQSDVLASAHSRSLRWLYWLYRPFEQALLRRARLIIVASPPYLETSIPLAPHRDRCKVIRHHALVPGKGFCPPCG